LRVNKSSNYLFLVPIAKKNGVVLVAGGTLGTQFRNWHGHDMRQIWLFLS
jgi:hypothetical protein